MKCRQIKNTIADLVKELAPEFEKQGHNHKLIVPLYIKYFNESNKNHANAHQDAYNKLLDWLYFDEKKYR